MSYSIARVFKKSNEARMSLSQDRSNRPDDDELDFVEARYPLQLDLPTGHENSLADAG